MTLPVLSDFSLTEIRYKNNGHINDLTAMQLVFANGHETELFDDSDDKSGRTQSIKIASRNGIGSVSVLKVEDVNNAIPEQRIEKIKGLRLWDRNGKAIVNKTWRN